MGSAFSADMVVLSDGLEMRRVLLPSPFRPARPIDDSSQGMACVTIELMGPTLLAARAELGRIPFVPRETIAHAAISALRISGGQRQPGSSGFGPQFGDHFSVRHAFARPFQPTSSVSTNAVENAWTLSRNGSSNHRSALSHVAGSGVNCGSSPRLRVEKR